MSFYILPSMAKKSKILPSMAKKIKILPSMAKFFLSYKSSKNSGEQFF